MNFNIWKLGTFVLFGFLLVGFGVWLAQIFRNNSYQQSNVITNSVNNEVAKVAETNLLPQSPNKDSQKQTKIINSQQKPDTISPPAHTALPQQNQQPTPRYTFDQVKSLVMNKSKQEVLSLLGRLDNVGEYSNESQAWTYRNIAYDSLTGKISNSTTIWFKKLYYDGEYIGDVKAREISF